MRNVMESLDRVQPGKTRTAVIYPTGTFAIAHVPQRKTGPRRNRLSRDEIQTMSDLQASEGTLFGGIKAGNCPLLGLLTLARGSVQDRPNSGGHLGSSKRRISHKRSPRGSRGISTRARDRLSYSAAYLEWKYKRTNLSFLTYTLPPLSDSDLKKVQTYWSEIVRQVVQEIKRALRRRGIETDVAGATEIQSKRLRRTGQCYPHLHLLFKGKRPSRKDWAMRPEEFRRIFIRIVQTVAGVALREQRACENVRGVRKSVAAYLGKYLSKCASKQPESGALGWHPSDWVVLSRSLRRRYGDRTIRMTGIAVEHFADAVFGDKPPGGIFVRPFEIQTRAGPRIVAWYGHSPTFRMSYLDYRDGAL